MVNIVYTYYDIKLPWMQFQVFPYDDRSPAVDLEYTYTAYREKCLCSAHCAHSNVAKNDYIVAIKTRLSNKNK